MYNPQVFEQSMLLFPPPGSGPQGGYPQRRGHRQPSPAAAERDRPSLAPGGEGGEGGEGPARGREPHGPLRHGGNGIHRGPAGVARGDEVQPTPLYNF